MKLTNDRVKVNRQAANGNLDPYQQGFNELMQMYNKFREDFTVFDFAVDKYSKLINDNNWPPLATLIQAINSFEATMKNSMRAIAMAQAQIQAQQAKPIQ